MMTKVEEQALKEFMLDIDCIEQLNKWSDNFNLFDVLGIVNVEIRHSNILAWLFNPNENHGLGDSFIKSFITKVVSNSVNNKYDTLKILLQDFYSYQVFRELNHIDIILQSIEEKTVVIIENKIWSKESPKQLKNYYKKVKTEYDDDYKILYVFLTPNGIESSDPDIWTKFSYKEIVKSLEESIKGKKLRDEVLLLIKNYIDIVRGKIMKEKDEDLVLICNEIYNKHRAALRLIYENINIDNSSDNEIIMNTLKEMADKGKIIIKDEKKRQFFTKTMDEFLPSLKEKESSWGTNWVYYYWFEKCGDKLVIHFEIGGYNLTDELKNKTDALIKASKRKIDDYRYKRLYYNSIELFSKDNDKDNDNDYEASLKNATEYLVKEALKEEKTLITNAKKLLPNND